MSPAPPHPNDNRKHRSFSDEMCETTIRLNRRIALVACIVMAELAALTVALESWAEGHTSSLGWLVGFQLICFVGAMGVGLRPVLLVHRSESSS